jgi:hypothetical protein
MLKLLKREAFTEGSNIKSNINGDGVVDLTKRIKGFFHPSIRHIIP